MKLESIIGENKKFIIFLFVFTGAVTVLKGINLPNSWALTHYAFTYETGFLKRAFTGTFFSMILGDFYFQYITLLVIVFLVYLAALYLLFRAVGREFSKNVIFAVPALLFLTSPGFVFFNHIVGYFDQIGFLITIALITLIKSRKIGYNLIFLLSVLSCILLVFIHEAQIILYAPLIFFAVITMKLRIDNRVKPVQLFTELIKFSLPVLTILGAVLFFGETSQTQIQALTVLLDSKTDFNYSEMALGIYKRSMETNFKDMISLWSDPYFIYSEIVSFLVIFPGIFALFYYLHKSVLKQADLYFKILAYISALSPLVLYSMGLDIQRWNNIAFINTFLICILLNDTNSFFRYNDKKSYYIFITVFILHLVSDNFFFKNGDMHLYPFREHLEFYLEVLSGKIPLPPV